MDDYTWRRRLYARRRRRRTERVFVLFLLMIAISCVIWYFTSYTKTPAYAMNETFAALQNGDVETFKKHVDLEEITRDAYDDLTGDLFEYDTQLSTRERLLFENFYVLIRPQMCVGAIKVLNTRLETGEWILPEEILKGRQLGIDFDLLLERSLIRHTTITGVENVKNLGEKATAEIKVVEDYSQLPFTLQVTLESGGAGFQFSGSDLEIFGQTFNFSGLSFNTGENDWKIVSVDNYKEYLSAVAPLLQGDVTNYIASTSEIISHYNDVLSDAQSNFIVLQRSSDGIIDSDRRAEIVNYINQTIIPTLESRQAELDQIHIPAGATYLANLRRSSTVVTIQAWQYYARGLAQNNLADFGTAESIHKQELALDQRIEEIIRNSAVSKSAPELP